MKGVSATLPANGSKTGDKPAPKLLLSTTPTHKFLLMTSDRVVEGEISQDAAGGFLHKRSSGVIRYEDSMVVAVADSIEELCTVKMKLVPENDLSERFKIVEWCLAHKLTDQAKQELERILKYQPGNEQAQRRYRRLMRSESAAENPPPKKKHEAPRPPSMDPSQVIADFKAANGPEAFEHFKIVEAMMLNRCGTSGCHGGLRYAGDFKLVKPREGNLVDPKMTARNLQSILAGIDMRQPGRSPILIMALEGKNHGTRGLPPLAGINDPLFQDLKDWVSNVSESATVDRGRPDTPSRRRMNARNRSYAGTPTQTPIHPLWNTEKGSHGRIVLEDGRIREYGLPADPPTMQRNSARGNGRSDTANMAGDDVGHNRPGFGAQVADDAPSTSAVPEKTPAKVAKTSKSQPLPKTQAQAAAPKSADPNDPSQFNSQSGSSNELAPPAKPLSSAVPQRRQATKAAIPKSVQLPGEKRGQTFDAAPGPINGKQPQ